MWFLVHCDNDKKRLLLHTNQPLMVGRTPDNYLMVPELSVSRSHAEIFVEFDEKNLGDESKRPVVRLKDLSKVGTFINGNKIDPNQSTVIENDVIQFGTSPQHQFRLTYDALTICSSCLRHNDKLSLRCTALKLGAHLLNDWSASCTHLCMTSITITAKLIQSLISNIPIVTLQYFTELLSCAEKKQFPHVDADFFLPPVDEEEDLTADDINFYCDPVRKTLFAGKIFYFLTDEQMKRLGLLISLAQGFVEFLAPERRVAAKYSHKDSCVISAPIETDPNIKKWMTSLADALKKKNKRLIEETEISLAILHCSSEMYCNPSASILHHADFQHSVLSNPPSVTPEMIDSDDAAMQSALTPTPTSVEAKSQCVFSEPNKARKRRNEIIVEDSASEINFKELRSKKQKHDSQHQLEETPDINNENVGQNLPDHEQMHLTRKRLRRSPAHQQLANIRSDVDCPTTSSSSKAIEKNQRLTSLSNDHQSSSVVVKTEPQWTPESDCTPPLKKQMRLSDCRSTNSNDGFINGSVKQDDMEESATDLIETVQPVVEICSNLLRAAVLDTNTAITTDASDGVINYKRFKKAIGQIRQGLPLIIGGRDLIPYDQKTNLYCNNWLEDHNSTVVPLRKADSFDDLQNVVAEHPDSLSQNF